MPDENHETELRAWVETATDGLCDVARERVCNEIRAHYTEAVVAEMAFGRSEEDARRLAVAALGDAEKARRAFRKTYLTMREAVILEGYLRPLPLGKAWRWIKVLFPLMVCVAIFQIVKGLIFGFAEDGYRSALATSSLVIGFVIVLWLRPRLVKERQWRRGAVWDIIASVLVLSSIAVDKRGLVCAMWIIAFLLVVLLQAVNGVSILRKVGKHADLYDSILNSNDNGGRCA